MYAEIGKWFVILVWSFILGCILILRDDDKTYGYCLSIGFLGALISAIFNWWTIIPFIATFIIGSVKAVKF